MNQAESSWGLSPRERRIVLGIRAAGLFLVGLGIPVVQVICTWLGLGGRTMSILELIQSKQWIVTFVSATGPYLVAAIAGLYLMRCDPRALLRSTGAKV
jgi:hypothetical protein